jgi:hypothetical protein
VANAVVVDEQHFPAYRSIVQEVWRHCYHYYGLCANTCVCTIH